MLLLLFSAVSCSSPNPVSGDAEYYKIHSRQGSQLKKVDASAPKAAPASKLPKAAASLAEQIAARRAHMGGAGDDDGNTGDLSWM